MRRLMLTLLGAAILLTGCNLLHSGNQQPAFNCVIPSDSCGQNFRVTNRYEAQSVYGWNVTVNPEASREEITTIADNLASSRNGRRFVIFYSEDNIGFCEAPTSPEPNQLPIKTNSDSWVAIFDYFEDMPPRDKWHISDQPSTCGAAA